MNYASASQRYLAVLGSQPEAAGRVAEGLARIGEHAGHAAEVIKRLRAFLRRASGACRRSTSTRWHARPSASARGKPGTGKWRWKRR